MTTTFNESADGNLTAEQRVGSAVDHRIDWSAWLASETIASSAWASLDSRLSLSMDGVSGSETHVRVEVPESLPSDWYVLENTVTSSAGRRESRVCLIYVKPGISDGSLLFPNRIVAVMKMRRDRLLAAAAGALPSITVSDEFLWDKLRAAESEIAHELRVPLAPTHFFPTEPTEAEIQALNGAPWGIDPGYDYAPEDFQFNDKWGMIKLRNKPLHSVSRVRFAYPGGPTAHYDLPLDWLRMDRKYGQIQFVPSSTAFAAPLNAFVMQAIGAGRTIPLAIQISYVAGLKDAAYHFPELLDAVLKLAVIKIIEDAFLPASGSISADGLSQSISNDMDKHHDAIDRILRGGKGSNGGLITAIHGIRVGVV